MKGREKKQIGYGEKCKVGKKKESFGKESDRTVEKVKRIDAIGSEKWKK